VSAVKLDKITDAAFTKPKEAKKSGKKSEGEFFAQTDKKVRSISLSRILNFVPTEDSSS